MKQTIYIPVKAGEAHDGLLFEAGKGGLTGTYLKAIEMPSEEELNKMGYPAWEEDVKTNPHPHNPWAFQYGWRLAVQAITKLMKGETT